MEACFRAGSRLMFLGFVPFVVFFFQSVKLLLLNVGYSSLLGFQEMLSCARSTASVAILVISSWS